MTIACLLGNTLDAFISEFLFKYFDIIDDHNKFLRYQKYEKSLRLILYAVFMLIVLMYRQFLPQYSLLVYYSILHPERNNRFT